MDVLVAELVEFKAFDLFSLTFGVGVAVQAERAALRAIRVEPFLVRRFLILLAFGACHLVLISNVDILALYAVCGLLVIPFLRLPAAVLALAGLAAVYLPAVFPRGPVLPPEPVLHAHAAKATRLYSQGSFGALLAFRWHETQELIGPLLLAVAQKTWGLMLLGVAVWRSGIVREPERRRLLLWAVCLGAAVVSITRLLGSHVLLALAYAAGIVGVAALRAVRRVDRSGSGRRPDGSEQLSGAIAAVWRSLLRLWIRPVRTAAHGHGSGHGSGRLRRAALVQRLVARSISVRTLRVALALDDLRPPAADASPSPIRGMMNDAPLGRRRHR